MRKMGFMVVIVVIAAVAVAAVLVTRYYDDRQEDGSKASTTAPAGQSNTSTDAKEGEVTGRIEIANNSIFTPSQITVRKGEAVMWTNNDDKAHTVTADLSNTGGPASGTISPGDTYTFTFKESGSYQYHCEMHPDMRGTIVVK